MPIAPPTDFAGIRQSLISAAALATGLDPGNIILNQPPVPNSPRPAKPYMGLNAIVVSAVRGWDENAINTDDATGELVFQSYGQRSMQISCQTYADSQDTAYALMSSWQAGLRFPNIVEPLRAAGVAVWDMSEIRDLSALLDTAWEGRAQMDLTCGVAAMATFQNPDIITSATVQVNFAPPDSITVTIGG